MVEEHTPIVEAHLEAVALGSAAVGEEFDVRLRVGGKVLRAVALGPGRAELQAERKAQP
jgi:flagella basal body P-ring formation protein FlgA